MTAVALADRDGVEGVSMRKIAQELGVVPMALYKHVAGKDELLGGMIDVVVAQIDPPATDLEWKPAIRARILSARRALLRHPWASRVMESRTEPTPTVLAYMDSMIGMFRAGGFSMDLTHHAVHAMGSRLMGFSQELFNDSADTDPAVEAEMWGTDGRHLPLDLRAVPHGLPRRPVRRRPGLRRPVRVRVRAGPDARRPGAREGRGERVRSTTCH